MGLAPSGQHENTTNLLYAEVPVPIYSHRRWAGKHLPPQDGRFRQGMARRGTTKAYLCIDYGAGIQIATLDPRLRGNDCIP
jgi:hypothetical protein